MATRSTLLGAARRSPSCRSQLSIPQPPSAAPAGPTHIRMQHACTCQAKGKTWSTGSITHLSLLHIHRRRSHCCRLHGSAMHPATLLLHPRCCAHQRHPLLSPAGRHESRAWGRAPSASLPAECTGRRDVLSACIYGGMFAGTPSQAACLVVVIFRQQRVCFCWRCLQSDACGCGLAQLLLWQRSKRLKSDNAAALSPVDNVSDGYVTQPPRL